jgi:hypothetical protein
VCVTVPDSTYDRLFAVAAQRRISVPELLRRAVIGELNELKYPKSENPTT